MKKFLAVLGLSVAVNGFAQSYLILNNGITLTTDKAGFVYDFSNFIMPNSVNLTGGQFLAVDGKFVTISDKGFLFRKDNEAPKKVSGKGLNYVLNEKGFMYTVDANGFIYEYDKDSNLKNAANFGGNFFTVKPDARKPDVDLYTVNDKGNYFKMVIQGLNPADITTFGGSYFATTQGTVFTVTKDGFVYSKSDIKTGTIKRMGGNYFVDSNNAIYTVSEEGFLILPGLPMSLKIANITKLGANYFLDMDGRVYTVDKAGNISEREMKDHDLKNAKIISM